MAEYTVVLSINKRLFVFKVSHISPQLEKITFQRIPKAASLMFVHLLVITL
jgi:hypothetical protein